MPSYLLVTKANLIILDFPYLAIHPIDYFSFNKITDIQLKSMFKTNASVKAIMRWDTIICSSVNDIWRKNFLI